MIMVMAIGIGIGIGIIRTDCRFVPQFVELAIVPYSAKDIFN